MDIWANKAIKNDPKRIANMLAVLSSMIRIPELKYNYIDQILIEFAFLI